MPSSVWFSGSTSSGALVVATHRNPTRDDRLPPSSFAIRRSVATILVMPLCSEGSMLVFMRLRFSSDRTKFRGVIRLFWSFLLTLIAQYVKGIYFPCLTLEYVAATAMNAFLTSTALIFDATEAVCSLALDGRLHEVRSSYIECTSQTKEM